MGFAPKGEGEGALGAFTCLKDAFRWATCCGVKAAASCASARDCGAYRKRTRGEIGQSASAQAVGRLPGRRRAGQMGQ